MLCNNSLKDIGRSVAAGICSRPGHSFEFLDAEWLANQLATAKFTFMRDDEPLTIEIPCDKTPTADEVKSKLVARLGKQL